MKTNKEHIPDLLFQSAQGFYEIGINTATYLQNTKDGYQFTQKIAPAAVNICFATELLLKGLILLSFKTPKGGHSLTSLFFHLPAEIRKLIFDRYEHYQVNDKEIKDLGAYKMVITKGTEENNQIDDENINLEKLLETHDKGFEKWRYIFEIENEGYTFEIDFKSMNCFIKSIADAINSIPRKQRFFLEAAK